MPDDASGGSSAADFSVVHAVRDALPTRAHADMVFSMAADILGDAALVEESGGGTSRTLFRRESPGSPWIVPWPLLTLVHGGREGPSPVLTGVPGVYMEPNVRPGAAPKIRGLGPGRISFQDGPRHLEVSYGADGRWFECAVGHAPREMMADVVPRLAARSAAPAEIVAACAASIDTSRHGPGRVQLPVPLPGGHGGVWRCGLYALREALFGDRVPGPALHAAADGWLGSAMAYGATRDGTVEAWRKEVARVRPFPERPPDLPAEASAEHVYDGTSFGMRVTVRITGGIPWVEPTEDNTPVAVIPVRRASGIAPPLGELRFLADDFGNLRPVAVRRDPGGFTMVGEELFGHELFRHDPAGLDDRLDAADRAWDERFRNFPRPEGFPEPPPTDCSIRAYRIADSRSPACGSAAVESASRTLGFAARGFDADRLRRLVVRMRRDDPSGRRS